MPSVRMRTNSAGPDGNRSAKHVYPVTAEEGRELVAGGFADWVEAPKPEVRVVETATVAPSETAMRPAAQPRRRR